jgi:hypothetical protein
MTHINDKIICPKCETHNLRKAIPQKLGVEYFCDKCHLCFDIQNLVNFWGFDAADLLANSDIMSNEPTFEPLWETWLERNDEYEVVGRMLLNIPEWEDIAVDYGYPIGAVGC